MVNHLLCRFWIVISFFNHGLPKTTVKKYMRVKNIYILAITFFSLFGSNNFPVWASENKGLDLREFKYLAVLEADPPGRDGVMSHSQVPRDIP